jgi:hypothetical protein
MRDYSKAAPTFWTGKTGRQIRNAGRDVQVMAFYLFSCPNSNWIGLYYLPLPTLCHEVGISKEGALKALQKLSEIDFAYYDWAQEFVWVPGAAKFQIADSLKPADKRILGIVKDLQRCENSEFVQDFCRRYQEPFCLPEIKLSVPTNKPLASPFEGPPKPVTETEAEARTETEARAKPLRGFLCELGKCAHEDAAQCQEDFKIFWKSYPRHAPSRIEALKSWCKARKTGTPELKELLAWISQAQKSEQWQDKSKIPHATTWLNQRRWEGEPPPPPQSKSSSKQQEDDAFWKRMEEQYGEPESG